MLLCNCILVVSIPSYGQLGQSKQLLGQGMAPDSTYLLKYETKVRNLGTEAICGVEVYDDITTNYTPCDVIGTDVVNAYGQGGLDVWSPNNQGWDGGIDWDNNGAQTMFDIGSIPDSICVADCGAGFCLSPGQTVVLYFVVKLNDLCFPAAGSTITFTNSATSLGQSSGGTNYTETSSDGSDPAAAGTVPTPADVGYTEATIGAAQTITDTLGNLIVEPPLNTDGTYDFSYHITICNYEMMPNGGGATIYDLAYWLGLTNLIDLGVPINQSVVLNPAGPLIPNPTYDGIWGSRANVLDDYGGDLDPGICDTLEIRINAGPVPSSIYDSYDWFNGTASGWDGSETIRDDSHDGYDESQYDPDPNPTECLGATDNCYASRIKFNANPGISLQKEFVKSEEPSSGTLGQVDLVWRLTVTNIGDVNLTNLSVLDSLVDQWTGACLINVISDSTMVTNIDATNPPTPNTGFTGASSGAGGTADLLNGSSTDLLGLNESFQIYFRVEVAAENCADPLPNDAMAYGEAPNGDLVEDPANDQAVIPELGKIGDTIQNDDDNTPISGVMVVLYDGDGNPLDTAYTNSSGMYLFEGVYAGDYQVSVDSTNFDLGGPLEGLENSTDPDDTLDNTAEVTITPGEENLDQDFGYTIVVLPIELISFNIVAEGCSNRLSWETASEVNSAYFEIQRSLDGEYFKPIGQINAAGYSNTLETYTFEDRSPEFRKVYYRLKQVDIDGVFEFFQIDWIENACYADTPWAVELFPNPTKDRLRVLVTLEQASEMQFKLYDLQGRLLKTKVVPLEPGTNHLVIETNDLAEGKYIIQLISAELFVSAIPFVKIE